MRIVVVKSFVCNQPYDMATCIAMFTNISATVIFVARVEMHFHDKYKAYSEAVIGGKKTDIDNAKRQDVPRHSKRADEPCADTVYHIGGGVPAVHRTSAAVWDGRHGHAYLSLYGGRIFHFIPYVCGDSVLILL